MAVIPQNLGVPTGTVMWSAAPDVPVGWLLCDGRFVAVADYPVLYAYIGNTYGGDSTTFQLPDLVGRFIKGAGELGRDPFTYQDGMNKEHLHGMFPNQTHTHGVSDPQHEHPTSSGSHTHSNTSSHAHTNTTKHLHSTSWGGQGSPYANGFVTHDYTFVGGNCDTETYAPTTGLYPHCERNPETDFFVTVTDGNPFWTNPLGLTGITQVNTNVTSVSTQIAFTNVTLIRQITGTSANSALSNLSVDPYGAVGGARPKNIAFLPIIRT